MLIYLSSASTESVVVTLAGAHVVRVESLEPGMEEVDYDV